MVAVCDTPGSAILRRADGPRFLANVQKKIKRKKNMKVCPHIILIYSIWETDRFFAASGVQLTQTDRGQFHFRRVVFSSHLKSRVGNILSKDVVLHITLNLDHLDGETVVSQTHSPITLENFSSINLIFIFRCSSSPINPVYTRRVDSSVL